MNQVYICDSSNNNPSFINVIMNLLNRENIDFTNINLSRRNIKYNNTLIYIIDKSYSIQDITNNIYHYISKNKILFFKKVIFVTNIINNDDYKNINSLIKNTFGNKGRIYNSISFDTIFADIIVSDIIKNSLR